ncbi:MAG: cohesin domain-containing protein [Candidatus Gracilibacteria bacterium]|nr:cohesin domain-containing protein [Candidatus Gracilibacteria bacterium]
MSKKTLFSALLIATFLGACTTQSGASFGFSQEEVSLNVGEEVTVDMVLNSEVAIDAVDALLIYDEEMLSLERASKGEIFEIYPFKVVDNKEGEAKISAASRDNFFTGTGTYATLTFKALQAGESTVSYVYDKKVESHSDTDVMSQGQDLLGKVQTLTVNAN